MTTHGIRIDDNGWIDPTCPHCECVMEFNYTNWHRSGTHVFQYPDLNLYCRRCHFAVHIRPATICADSTVQTFYEISQYGFSNCYPAELEE